MAIGERIKFIRKFRKKTQKELGLSLGFNPSTAESRIGQYEIGVARPRQELINRIAEILAVSPQALALPDIDNDTALLHTLFAIEDIYGLSVNMVDDEFCLTLDRENPAYFAMYDILRAWNRVSRKYRNGEITKEEYDNWRYNYPNKADA